MKKLISCLSLALLLPVSAFAASKVESPSKDEKSEDTEKPGISSWVSMGTLIESAIFFAIIPAIALLIDDAAGD